MPDQHSPTLPSYHPSQVGCRIMSDQQCPTLPSYHPSQVGCRIMSDQQWSLAPLHGVLACARPGYLLAGPLGRPGTHSLTLTLTSALTLLAGFLAF